jgi:hypothetical protein
VADSKYAGEFAFDEKNLLMMKLGQAPYVRIDQHLSGRRKYEIHHLDPIKEGGGVYNLDNLVISTPHYHMKYFHSK